MQFSSDHGGFGPGGKHGDGEPLEKVRRGAAQGLDREWAFKMLTNNYVATSQMTPSRRSNILAKIYGRIRLNKSPKTKTDLFHIWPMHTTTAPPEYITESELPKKKFKSSSDEGQKTCAGASGEGDIRFGYTRSPVVVNTSKTMTMYNGDVWTRREYGICKHGYWVSHNPVNTDVGSAAPGDFFWYCWRKSDP